MPATARKRTRRPPGNRRLSYIPSPEFATLTSRQLEAEAPESLFKTEVSTEEHDEAFRSPLLTRQGERHLFRKMNFLRFQIHQLGRQGNSGRSGKSSAAIRDLEQQIDAIRDQIVKSNLRLVAAIAHKFARSPSGYEELISEGNLILVNAVDKFDYSRGFRFSTYATHAVQRHFYRLMQRRQRRNQRETTTPQDLLAHLVPAVEQDPRPDVSVIAMMRDRFADCLDERERIIIEERFGLKESGEESPETLKAVSEKIGLSKERVRQLQMRAIAKLRDLALQLRLQPETCL